MIWKIREFCSRFPVGTLKLESVWTLLKITLLASRKSYLVIIGSNSYEKLESDGTLLRITCLAHRRSYLVIMFPNSHEKLPKLKLAKLLFVPIWVCLILFCTNISFFAHCRTLLIYIFAYLALFTHIYNYLPLFGRICSNLTICAIFICAICAYIGAIFTLEGLRGIVITLCVCMCVCPANILVFYKRYRSEIYTGYL